MTKWAIIRERRPEDKQEDVVPYEGKEYVIQSIGDNRARLHKLAVISDDICLAEVQMEKAKITKLLKLC